MRIGIGFAAGALSLGLGLSVAAQTTRSLDLRKQSDADGIYSLALCARPSPDTALKLPGHMFVSYSHQDKAGKRTFRAVGHTTDDPGGALLSYSQLFPRVSGYLKDEIYTNAMQRCLELLVNKPDYESAWALATSPLARLGITDPSAPVLLAYRLGSEDCMGFALQVATLFKGRGLVIPQRGATEAPMPYLRRIIDENAAK